MAEPEVPHFPEDETDDADDGDEATLIWDADGGGDLPSMDELRAMAIAATSGEKLELPPSADEANAAAAAGGESEAAADELTPPVSRPAPPNSEITVAAPPAALLNESDLFADVLPEPAAPASAPVGEDLTTRTGSRSQAAVKTAVLPKAEILTSQPPQSLVTARPPGGVASVPTWVWAVLGVVVLAAAGAAGVYFGPAVDLSKFGF